MVSIVDTIKKTFFHLLEKYNINGSNPSPQRSFKYSWKKMSPRPRKNIAGNWN